MARLGGPGRSITSRRSGGAASLAAAIDARGSQSVDAVLLPGTLHNRTAGVRSGEGQGLHVR